MTFDEILVQALDLLQRQGRVSYRALKRRFALDDDYLEDLKAEIIKAQRLAVDEDGEVLVWTGTLAGAGRSAAPAQEPVRAPHAYTPPHLAEKILTSRSALAGERKQVTVLFADLKGSMELLADRDPEEARQLLDPVLERLMAAVHRYEGTVNQVMGDGIMALFGAPIAHEDHHEFTHASRTQGWLLLESSSTSYGKATPYLPVIDLLKAYFQIEDRDDGRRMREKLTGRLLTLDATLGPTLPAFLALLEVPVEDAPWQALDPSQRRQRTLDALKRLLLRES